MLDKAEGKTRSTNKKNINSYQFLKEQMAKVNRGVVNEHTKAVTNRQNSTSQLKLEDQVAEHRDLHLPRIFSTNKLTVPSPKAANEEEKTTQITVTHNYVMDFKNYFKQAKSSFISSVDTPAISVSLR